MSQERKIKQRTQRRILRVRSKMKSHVPRVTVFRSLKQFYAQIIDDKQERTLLSGSSVGLGKSVKGDKKALAHAVGKELATRALKEGISQVTFDRGAYLFHGRVKAFVDGLIEGGMII